MFKSVDTNSEYHIYLFVSIFTEKRIWKVRQSFLVLVTSEMICDQNISPTQYLRNTL